MPSRLIIDDFAMDDVNEDEFAEHGITQRQLFEVLDSQHRIKMNRRGRRATHMMIGRGQQGQCIAIPVEPTSVRTTWRPVAAWFCQPHEWGWLPKRR